MYDPTGRVISQSCNYVYYCQLCTMQIARLKQLKYFNAPFTTTMRNLLLVSFERK